PEVESIEQVARYGDGVPQARGRTESQWPHAEQAEEGSNDKAGIDPRDPLLQIGPGAAAVEVALDDQQPTDGEEAVDCQVPTVGPSVSQPSEEIVLVGVPLTTQEGQGMGVNHD